VAVSARARGRRSLLDPPVGDRDNIRDGNRNDGRRERRIDAARSEAPRAIEPALIDEGPIPGLPGPATLRTTRDDAAPAPTARPERRTLRRDAPVKAAAAAAPERAVAAPEKAAAALEGAAAAPVVEAAVSESVEVPAPRRRGRPRKVVDDVVAEG